MQLIPKRYAELEAQLKALQAADGPAVWQGLIRFFDSFCPLLQITH